MTTCTVNNNMYYSCLYNVHTCTSRNAQQVSSSHIYAVILIIARNETWLQLKKQQFTQDSRKGQIGSITKVQN